MEAQRTLTMIKYVTYAIAFFLFYTNQALGGYSIDELNFNMLPPHCQAKYAEMYKMGKVKGIKIDPNKYLPKVWAKRVGQPWGHFHHYCPGLIALNQAKYKASGRDKLLKKARGEFNYVISHSKFTASNGWLLAEVNLHLAEVFELANQPGEVISHYQKSINANPRSFRSYLGLSKFYSKSGNTEEALAVVRRGLKKVPKSRSLKKQEQRLLKGKN